jgi:two-component system, sensor histidine kinase and response regulator
VVDKVSDETRTLRRTMRDLVALSALPAVWAGYQPRQVAEGLADVLLSTLRLDLVYLRLPGQTEGQEIEVARTAGRPTTTDEPRNIGRALAPWLDGGSADPAPSIPNPAGGGTVRLAIACIGGDRGDGVLVAGSQQTGFPSEADRLILTVGANQAATVLQRQRAEEALRRQAELLRLSYDAILVWRLDGGIESWSRGAEELYGFAEAEALGRVTHELLRTVHPVPWPEIEAKLRASGSWEGEIRHRTKDGREVIVSTRQQFVRDADGVWRVLESNRDITERKQAEEAIRESNERFRIVTKATNDAVWDWDLKTNKVWCSEGVLTLFGYLLEKDEADPAWWLERIHPEDRAAVEAFFFDVVRGKKLTWVDEYRFRCADGSYKDVYDRGYVLRDSEGRAVRMIGAMLDITARKRAEEALRESEHRWRSLTEALPQLVWTATPDGSADYYSTQCSDYTGLTESELLGWRWLETLHPDDRERARQAWTAAVEGRGAYDVEFRIRRSDGVHRWFKTRAVPIRDSEGTICKWFGTCTDISDGKRMEEELRLANARLDLAVRGSNIGIWEIDMADGDYLHGRRYYLNIWEQLGYEGPDFPPDHETSITLVHPDDRAPLEETMRKYLAGETSEFEVEWRVRHKDGSYRCMLARGVALRDAGGKPIRFLGCGIDITERKRLEAELSQALARLDLALRGSSIGIYELNMPDGVLENSRFEVVVVRDSSSYDRSEMRSTFATLMAILHPDDRERVEGALRAYLSGQTREYKAEFRARRRDGSYRWFLARGVAVRDAEGRAIRFMSSSTDITDLKRAEEELRLARDAAESANRAKDEFLANVSHEIRTPMNAILGMTELALDTPLSDDLRQCLRTVKSAADSLLGTINDLLDFSKIEAGKLELDPADFSLRAAVGDTLRALATRAHKKGLELACNVQPDVPDALVGDVGRLRQVLVNLVGNAIKFTEHGEVVVRVEVAGDPPPEEGAANGQTGSPAVIGEVGLRFTVTDSGIGILQDKQERIFRAFEQEDTSTTRKYGGTGLGLTIAARLVALMGGSILVESEPGRGSTFAFTGRFGRQPHSAEQAPAWPPVLLKALRVLVVDDNPTNRHILEEWLTGWQMEPVAVGDGLAALGALWDAVSVGRPYPLVLLDARMPDTDGLALAARIRERAALSAIRIILLTSEHRPGDSARSHELRIDAHLLKPVQQDELLETIYRVMSRALGDPPMAVEELAHEPGPVPAPAAAPLHILLAEDNEFSAQLLETLLARRGHRVRLATNGREALALAGQGAFDLMLLDVHMPELDGFEVVREVREGERAAGGHLPVVALTARSRKEDRERCLAAGMDDFLTKPVSAVGLLEAIDRLVPSHLGRRKAEGGWMKKGDDPVPPSSLLLPPSKGGLLDPVAVLTACGDDAEALRGMCQTFETYLPVRLTEVGDALRAQDAPGLREAAHRLCALLFAFSTTAGNAASDLEDHAAQGRLDEAWPLVQHLETMGQELVRLAAGLSLETLRQQAEATGDP